MTRRTNRRDFLKVGAIGGLSLAGYLRMAQAGEVKSTKAKAAIFINLQGGPSHMDMYDLKPDAPAEFRGEFHPIRTHVPGIQICEHLPRLAACMDRFAVIRSIVGGEDRHASFQCMTGRRFGRQPAGGWPASTVNAVISPGNVSETSRNRPAAACPGAGRPAAMTVKRSIAIGSTRPSL